MAPTPRNNAPTSEVLSDLLWTEKYRPQSLDGIAMDPAVRATFQSYLEAGEIPHLLLSGPAGSGKTTLARIFMRELDCAALVLNASSERGIDTVRGKIGSFVTAKNRHRWNIVLLDESDEMTADAQTALRNLMESYAKRSRFIFTANKVHKIIGPIQSRCQAFTMGRPPLKERYRILANVLKQEGVTVVPQTVLGYAEKFPDMRRMLFATQQALLSQGDGQLPVTNASNVADGAQMLEWLLAFNLTAFRHLGASPEFDAQQSFRELFYAIPLDHERAGFLCHVIGKGLHESGFTPDPIVLFQAVMGEAMEGLK